MNKDRQKQARSHILSMMYRVFILLILLTGQTGHAGDSDTKAGQQIGGEFSLTDHNGKPFTLKSQRGKLVLIFFGYTYCPDICPTELSILSSVLHSLKEKANKVTSLFITVDPERDTIEKLKQYVPYFSQRMIGLTGSREAIEKVTEAYHVQYKIHSHTPEDKHYLVDHSANLYIVNGEGKLVNIIPFGLPVEHIKEVVDNELLKLE